MPLQNAGRGTPEVIVLDPKGKKDSTPVAITATDEPEVYKCEYVPTLVGLHSINVFFAGKPIPCRSAVCLLLLTL